VTNPPLHSVPADDLDARLGRAIAAWVDFVQGRARSCVLLIGVASAALLAYAWPRLGIDSNEDALFSEDVPYAALRREFRSAFPSLLDPILVVIDAESPDRVREASDALQERLLREPESFPAVYSPRGGSFLEQQGLLYLSPEALEDWSDRMAELQPYLGTLARDPSLRGLFSLLGQAAAAAADGEFVHFELTRVLERVGASVRARLEGRARELSWAELLQGGEAAAGERLELLVVQPIVHYEELEPAAGSLARLRALIAELGLERAGGLRVRLTGLFPIAAEEAHLVSSQAAGAGVASFLLVAAVLTVGMRSARLVLATLAVLPVGLIWTAAFAAFAIGHLNLISVAFAVLFIGLSDDFGIQFSLRYRELVAQGSDRSSALRETGNSVGGALVVCAATTAIAFFSFLLTDFVGIAELGAIAGVGMFVSLFANLTLLPALLALGPEPREPAPSRALRGGMAALLAVPTRHARPIAALTAIATAASLALLPRLEFDLSPLRVRDPRAESLQAFDDLLASGMAFPWNLNALAPDRGAADRLAARLRELPAVRETFTLSDLVPREQERKLAILADAAFLLLPTLDPPARLAAPGAREQREAIRSLGSALQDLASRAPDAGLARAARALRASLQRLEAEPGDPAGAAARLAALESDLLRSLPRQLELLQRSLRARALSESDLPDALRRQLVAPDGRVRVEVSPREDLDDNAALARYVASVTEVAPRTFGEAIVIHETGRIVVRAFQLSLGAVACVIALSLLLLWRNWLDAALVALPLAVAALLTAAASAALGWPFNFANVIVIPLLLGMGVDTSIHLVHRHRYEAPGADLLRTSTARAVLLSEITTVGSFGTLAFATHRGMASLGELLTLGISLILLCNFVVLPAVLALAGGSARPARRHPTFEGR